MNENQSVLMTRDYGKISFLFKEVMDQKGINRNQLSKLADIRFEVSNRFYHGNIERLDLDVLAKICFVLGCEVGDVIKYEKP